LRRQIVLWGLLVLLFAGGRFANAQTSTLSGTVKDTTGAVISGASIVVKNQASGDQRKTVATREGVFSVPSLRSGTYSLTATAKGFETFTATDIALESSDAKAVNITLQVGTETVSVTVTAEASGILEVDTGAKSATFTGDDLQDMVLDSRNAAEVVKLMSGASMSANSGMNKSSTGSVIGIGTFAPGGTAAGLGGTMVNGQSIDMTVDGGHAFDPGAPGGATVVNANTDMISEIKVLASSFSAENDYGPVVVNVVTKGGGEHYHGQVHFYAQNSVLNANDANAKQNKQARADSHQYYPGAQLGGPIPLPWVKYNKNHNKLFFWDGFEFYRQFVDAGVARAVVPTPAMLTGDFSSAQTANLLNNGMLANTPTYSDTMPAAKWNAANNQKVGCAINAGVLTPSCIDSWGAALLADIYPKPNVDPAAHNGFNYIQSSLVHQNSWQNVGRVDWSVSDSTKVFVRYSAQRENQEWPMGVWGGESGDNVVPNPSAAIGKNSSDSLAVSLTHVFSPTLTSESTFNYVHIGFPNYPVNQKKIGRKELNLPLAIFGSDEIPSFGDWGPTFPGVGPGGSFTGDPMIQHAVKSTPSAKEEITKVFRAHTFKAGGFWEHILNNQDPSGSFGGFIVEPPSNWGNDTGNSFADMLMGVLPGGYSETEATPSIGVYSNQYRFFVTDHWKVLRRLTVDVGMRFDHFDRPSTTSDLGMAIFDQSKYSNDTAQLNNHPGLEWHGMNKSIPLSGVDSRLLFYSPRFGLAWDIFGKGKTILRGGYGKFRAYDDIAGDNPSGAAPVGWGAISPSCGSGNYDPTTPTSLQCPTFASVYSSQGLGQYSGRTLPSPLPGGLLGFTTVNPHDDEQPVVTTYNMQIDQRLPAKFLIEVSYVGNYGEHNQYEANLAAIPVGTVQYSTLLACTIAKNCPTWDNIDTPLKNYSSMYTTEQAGKTQYDGMQLSLHRNSKLFSMMANYTWSKAFANSVVGNGGAFSSLKDWGASEYWGISKNDRPQTLSATYTFNVPQIYVQERIARSAINGWQISGITTIESGANLTSSNGMNLQYAFDDLLGTAGDVTTTQVMHNNLALTGADSVTLFPTLTCNPNVHHRIPGVGMQYLNSACFSATTSGLGTTHMPYLAGPAFWNSDLGVHKNFKIERGNIEFKAQAFNFLNHALWSFNSGDANLVAKFNGDGSFKTLGSAGTNTFGVAQYKFGHRSMQFELRYSF